VASVIVHENVHPSMSPPLLSPRPVFYEYAPCSVRPTDTAPGGGPERTGDAHFSGTGAEPGRRVAHVNPTEFLTGAPLGIRVVVRTRLDEGYTDALGYLRSCDSTHCTVETKRGTVQLDLIDVVAAKEVPPAPAPRPRRRSPA
jgi:hypothetical protein